MFPANILMKYMFPIEIIDKKPIDTHNKIAEYLYLGNIHSLDDADKFYFIVNCTNHIKITRKCKTGIDDCMDTIRIPVDDHPTECERMLKYIESTRVLEKIHECRMKSKPVLVHCHAGIQRSAAIIACYIIKYYKMTPKEAIHFIQTKRPIAFLQQANFMEVIQYVYSHS